MKICVECGKELRILEGYQHPTFGKKSIVCSQCFNKVSESVARWRKFVLSNNFNNASCRGAIKFDWKKILPNITKIQDKSNSKMAVKEIEIKRYK